MNNPHRSLIFGGSGVVGREVSRMLAAKGGRVAFTYFRGKEIADELTKEFPEAIAIHANLSCVAEVEQAVEQAVAALGGLDAFVHCAVVGLSPGDPVPKDAHQRMEDVSETGWDQMFAINVRSAFFGCRQATSHLRQAGGGNIVLLGSIDGIKPLPSPVHYAATKGALVAMTQAMAKELGKDNIRVNLIAPGVLEAGVSRTLPQALLDDYLKHCGVHRFGKPAEIAAVVAWLALHNTYITGQSIMVDGAL